MGGARALVIGASLGMLLQAPACAKDLVRANGLYVHRRLGFAIAEPKGEVDTAWQRIRVDGTALSLRGPDGSTMSLLHECSRAAASPRLLAHQLLLGLEDVAILGEGPVQVEGQPAWSLTARARQEGRLVQIKTVTRRLGSCSLDWILIAPDGLAATEEVFDTWWRSYRTVERDGSPGGAAP